MTRDTIVFGLREEKVRMKCIEKGNNLTLVNAIDYARISEAEVEGNVWQSKQGSARNEAK
jgi:hypothetical protein